VCDYLGLVDLLFKNGILVILDSGVFWSFGEQG